jgi:hypothetical protein
MPQTLVQSAVQTLRSCNLIVRNLYRLPYHDVLVII